MLRQRRQLLSFASLGSLRSTGDPPYYLSRSAFWRAADIQAHGSSAWTVRLTPSRQRANTDSEIEAAFETITQQRIPALAVAASPFFDTRRNRLVELANRNGVPTIYHFREFTEAGGLMSYGISFSDAYRQVGVYTGRILKGAKPADLPVVQTTKFEFVINVKTAKLLGLKISDNLLSLADE